MMSEEDKEMLERGRPGLMAGLDIETGLLLAELRKRKVINPPQEDIIKVCGTCSTSHLKSTEVDTKVTDVNQSD